MYILGLDSGATNTTALLVDEELNILGHTESGPGNYYVAGKKSAEQNIKEAINKSIEQSGINRSDKIHAGLGIGNIDTDHDYEIVSELIDGLNFINNKKIVNDSKVAHYALTAGNAGISIVAGTGAIAYGDDGTSESRANGWGWLIGDRGSAFYTARQGLQKAAMAYDGRRPDTILIDRAISHFDLDEFPEIMQCVHEYIDHPKKNLFFF